MGFVPLIFKTDAMKLLLVAVIAAMPLLSFRCGRDLPVVDNETRLTSGPWKYANTMLKYDDGTTDFGPADACKQDDQFTFEVDGDAIVTYGPNNCSTAGISGKYGTWQLVDNDKSIKIVYNRDMFDIAAGTTVTYGILVLNDDQLVFSRMVTESGKTFQEDTYYSK